ncbi:MAG: inositol monophosphatase [bacterium]
MDLEKAFETVKSFVLSAAENALQEWDNKELFYHDNGLSISTDLDYKIEKDFYKFINENFPEHGFKGEEFPELHKDAEYMWFIDPIDGTNYYGKNVPMWSVTVSLLHNGQPIIGIIYNAVSKQFYHAIKGRGAYLNNEQLIFNSPTELNRIHAQVAYVPFNYYWDTHQDKVLRNLLMTNSNFFRVRMLGSGALSLAWTSQSMFGACMDLYRHESKFVDIEAGILICQEAGASYYKKELDENFFFTIVAKQEVIEKVIELIEF